MMKLFIGLLLLFDYTIAFLPSLRHHQVKATSTMSIVRKFSSFDALISFYHRGIDTSSSRAVLSSMSADENNIDSGNEWRKILVLGSTGFLGSEIVHQLSTRNIPFVGTSTSGRDGTIQLDLTSTTAQKDIQSIVTTEKCTAVISTVGSINTSNDLIVNSASGKVAARGARDGGARTFVFIGNDLRVRQIGTKVIPFLNNYMEGKEQSERIIRECFGRSDNDDKYSYCIIRPTFIYGGNDFGLNPPRITSSLGSAVEELLGNYAVQSISDELPDLLSLALDPPVSVQAVAAASINAALGLLSKEQVELDSRTSILDAVAVSSLLEREERRRKRRNEEEDGDAGNQEEEEEERKCMEEIKTQLLKNTAAAGGIGVGYDSRASSSSSFRTDLELMKDLESIQHPFHIKPAYNSMLNGQWDFVHAGPPTIATAIMEFLTETSQLFGPLSLFKFRETYLEVGQEQSVIRVVVGGNVLKRDVDLIIQTKLTPDERVVKNGTRMMERFDSVQLGGVDIPIPEQWKQSRQLDITFLDKDMMIARSGVMGDPHLLLRR
mmetsp:Transcript_6032/g.9148  ORF Transcript_6032/g.9148 Transcript_6032/m.9148 type:complete len:550 (-) Transcript_6032:363-2012(-)